MPERAPSVSGYVSDGDLDRTAPELGRTNLVAELKVGEGEGARLYRFWEGVLGEDPSLAALVRGLEVI